MRRKRRVWILRLLFATGLAANVLIAHPGRTNSSGCHTCKTNCPKWGLDYGEYHCHNSGSRARKPTIRSIPRKPEVSRRRPRASVPIGSKPEAGPNGLRHELVAVNVIDGDTFVAQHDGRLQRFRLHDADAPELTQDFGIDAKHLLESLILEKHLRVTTVQILSPDRQSVRVQLPDGRMLSRELIARGAAWCRHPQGSEASELCLEQELAQLKRRGLWHAARPVRPSEWQRQVREPQ